jgi:hypothetical protein
VTIVFGSPEAKVVLEKDKRLYGDARYPGDEPTPETPMEWKVTTTTTVIMERTYYVEALTQAEAREIVMNSDDYADEREVDDLGDEVIESVEKVEK